MANPNHNFTYKNVNADGICMPVLHNAQPQPQSQSQSQPVRAPVTTYANHSLNTQPRHLFPVVPFTHQPYTHPYQQFMGQFGPQRVPYYYALVPPAINYSYLPRFTAERMDVEKYINYELCRQQSLMRKQIVRPRPLSQLQLPSNRRPTTRTPAQTEPQERRIINVEVVAMAGSSRDSKPDVEPLPPVEPEFKERVAKINKSQQHYMQLFGRLTTMLQTLNRRYDGDEPEPEPEPENEFEDAPPPPTKRPRHDMSSSSSESHVDIDNAKNLAHYPQRIQLEDGRSEYVLGPNGTRITAKEYGQVFWTSPAVATRCLLAVLFSSDELATHTLTGKPSPAFYGRERPAKKMLDQRRVDDIVVSVRNRTGGKERNIRATITTKCADTSKKYKRRAKKALKDTEIIIEE